MYLNRKREKDRIEADRNLMLSYKKFFSSPEGKDVLFDLINKFNGINKIQGQSDSEKFEAIGAQGVVFYILGKTKMDVAHYDKMLNGDFNNG